MAKATAICKCSECGAEFEVTAYKRNRSEADSFERWAEEHITICDDCARKAKEAARAAENEKAARVATENGYPELTGTEKQVAWANTIRVKYLEMADEAIEEAKKGVEHYKATGNTEKIANAIIKLGYLEKACAMIRSNTSASFWIDRRDAVISMYDVKQNIVDFYKANKAEIENEQPEQPEQAKEPEEKPVRPEAVPETRNHDGSVDIHFNGEKVTAKYDRNDAFRQIVKGMGFVWNDAWTRTPSEITGTPENIAAELGSRLLNAGFAVRFDSQEILDRAVSGDYTPMCRRWIKNASTGFEIIWAREDDLYHDARSLPGARYGFGCVTVPERSWAAVVDFAAKHGCRITAKAQEKLDRLSGVSQAVKPAPVQKPEYHEQNILQSSREILPDLRDE